MRIGPRRSPSDSDYYNKEVALNELLASFVSNSASVTQVNDSNVAQTLLAANDDRVGFMIFNDSTATLFVKFGSTPTSSDFSIKLRPQGYYESGALCYNGVITGIWDSNASGFCTITELT